METPENILVKIQEQQRILHCEYELKYRLLSSELQALSTLESDELSVQEINQKRKSYKYEIRQLKNTLHNQTKDLLQDLELAKTKLNIKSEGNKTSCSLQQHLDYKPKSINPIPISFSSNDNQIGDNGLPTYSVKTIGYIILESFQIARVLLF